MNSQLMKNFEINKESIFEIDNVLEGYELKQYDLEIEKIINNLWTGTGEIEDTLSHVFTITLKNKLLPSLYINYLSLIKLEEKYDIINVKVTTSIIDIIAKNLRFQLEPNRMNYDDIFTLTGTHSFETKKSQLLKRILSHIKSILILKWSLFKGVNVLYMNAGKLKSDFSLLPYSLDARHFKKKFTNELPQDIEKIKDIVKNNIIKMDLSIPSNLIIEVLEQKIFKYLPHSLNRIYSLVEFIKIQKIRLVISSATNNESFLCLLAAAKLAKIDSMIIPHGTPTSFNTKLNSYCTFQGTLNNYEPQYHDTQQFHLKVNWFA